MSNNQKAKATKDNEKQPSPAGAVVGVRFPEELLSQLDREVERRREGAPWSESTRVDVIREAVFRLLHPAPSLAIVAPLKLSPTSQEGAARLCLVCNGPLALRNTSLCGKVECTKEIRRRRAQERRAAARG